VYLFKGRESKADTRYAGSRSAFGCATASGSKEGSFFFLLPGALFLSAQSAPEETRPG
jgi:hypothetical protein